MGLTHRHLSDPSPPRELLYQPNLERQQTHASAHASPAVPSTQPVVAAVVATDETEQRVCRGR